MGKHQTNSFTMVVSPAKQGKEKGLGTIVVRKGQAKLYTVFKVRKEC